MIEQHQHQRQRVMTVFGKQNSAEALEKLNNLTARSMSTSMNERKGDEILSHHEILSPSPIAKLQPIHPDNYPVHLLGRYDPPTLSQFTSTKGIQTVVRISSARLKIELVVF